MSLSPFPHELRVAPLFSKLMSKRDPGSFKVYIPYSPFELKVTPFAINLALALEETLISNPVFSLLLACLQRPNNRNRKMKVKVFELVIHHLLLLKSTMRTKFVRQSNRIKFTYVFSMVRVESPVLIERIPILLELR